MGSTLVDQVRSVQADRIELPILRDLVRRVQEMPPEQLRAKDRMWTDSDWRQWRQHSGHNPW